MREILEERVKDAEKTHEVNRRAYREALKASKDANAKTRALCDKASQSGNYLSALKKSLKEMPAEAPAAAESEAGE